MGLYRKSNGKNAESITYFGRLNQVLLLAAALVLLLLFIWNWRGLSKSSKAVLSQAVTAPAANEDVGGPQVKAAVEAGRLFPYSVIPGGARSQQELENALTHDPVAAAHYAGFDVALVHVIRLPRTEPMYVSYRVGSHIYWTSKRLEIPGGETVLTDGEHEARTRCGNRLSMIPQQPVALKEPSMAMLEGPAAVLPPAVLAESAMRHLGMPELATADPVGGRLFIPPFIPVWGDSGTPPLYPPPNHPIPPPPPTPPPPPPVATPEPSSLLLLSAGLLGLWGLRRKLHA